MSDKLVIDEHIMEKLENIQLIITDIDGTLLKDENGTMFTLLSTGMARYINANDIKNYTEILLAPNRKIGRTLFLN